MAECNTKYASVDETACRDKEFLTAENMPLLNIFQHKKVVYGEEGVHISAVQCWAARVCDGELARVSLNLTDKYEEFKLTDTSINSKRYCRILGKLKA
jgi:hypothetical protein